jgi:hypothetical protein
MDGVFMVRGINMLREEGLPLEQAVLPARPINQANLAAFTERVRRAGADPEDPDTSAEDLPVIDIRSL